MDMAVATLARMFWGAVPVDGGFRTVGEVKGMTWVSLGYQ